jgi:hypothetical protein
MKAKSFLVFLFVMAGFVLLGANTYAEDLYLQGNLASGTYYASGSIITSGTSCTVVSETTVLFMADQKAIFRAGFHVKTGGKLSIKTGRALDTDNDGLPDWWEIAFFGSLLKSGSDDLDGDGLTNAQEYQIHGDPLVFDNDTDDDGLNDVWELANFGSLMYGRDDDPDNDGFSNFVEMAGGSDPNNAGNKPKPGTYYEYDSLGRIKKIHKVK